MHHMYQQQAQHTQPSAQLTWLEAAYCCMFSNGDRQYTSIQWSQPLYLQAICIKAASLQTQSLK